MLPSQVIWTNTSLMFSISTLHWLQWVFLRGVILTSNAAQCLTIFPSKTYVYCPFRVWLTWTSLLKWYLAIWLQVNANRIKWFFLIVSPSPRCILIKCFLFLQPCACIQDSSWGLHGWCNHGTTCFWHAMLPMNQSSSTNYLGGPGLRGKHTTLIVSSFLFSHIG